MSGIDTFIGTNYIIMDIPPAEKRNPPRLIIYSKDYSKVQTEK